MTGRRFGRPLGFGDGSPALNCVALPTSGDGPRNPVFCLLAGFRFVVVTLIQITEEKPAAIAKLFRDGYVFRASSFVAVVLFIGWPSYS